jgi:hypothetical protein
MLRVKRVVAVVMMAISLLMVSNAAAFAAPNCSPGQHGNPSPGFKPGACK